MTTLPSSSSSSSPSPPSSLYIPTKAQHLHYLRKTISLAKLSPPKPSNFRVGCVLVSYPHLSSSSSSSSSSEPQSQSQSQSQTEEDDDTEEKSPSILSSGFTLELPTNTHAEQNALSKLTLRTSTIEEEIHLLLPRAANVYLYTSLEPCSVRLSGNKPCVNRIVDTTTKGDGYGIRKVVFGAKEPDTFVENSQSCKLLSEAGVEWEYIPDLEEEILRVAMEGHVKTDAEQGQKQGSEGVKDMSSLHARVDAMTASANTKTDVDSEEQRRQHEAEAQPRNPKKRMMEFMPQ